MPKVIGEVEQVALHAFVGQDIAFDVEWFEEDGTTARLIASVEGEVHSPDGDVVVDLSTFATVQDAPNSHIVKVLVPADTVKAFTHRSGTWYFALKESVSGEQKVVASGPFKLFGRTP